MGEENKSGFPPELSGMLTGLLSNPQALSMLSSMLGQMSPGKSEEKHVPPSSSHQPPPCPPPSCSKENDNRRNLLLALKPYMSPERCRAIERILMIQEALGLFQNGKKGP